MKPEDQFHDYTLASKLERFVAAVEQTLLSWQRTGLSEIIHRGYRARIKEQPSQVKVVASLQHRLPWRREPYILQLHLPTALTLAPGRSGVPYSTSTYTAPVRPHHQQHQHQHQSQLPQPEIAPADMGSPFCTLLPSAAPAGLTSQPISANPMRGAVQPAAQPQGQGQGQGQSEVLGGVAVGATRGVEGVGDDRPGAATSSSPSSSEGPYRDEHAVQYVDVALNGVCATGEDGLQKSTPVALPFLPQKGVATAAEGRLSHYACTGGAGGGGGGGASGGGEDASGSGGAASEAEPGWEVGVDLDLTELLSRIDTIVNDVEAQDTKSLDLNPGGSKGGDEMEQDPNLDLDWDVGPSAQGKREEMAAGAEGRTYSRPKQMRNQQTGTTEGRERQLRPPGKQRRNSLEESKGDQEQQLQQQQQVTGLDSCDGGRSGENSTAQNRGSSGTGRAVLASFAGDAAAAIAAASSRLVAVWPSGRPGALPWWLPTFQHRLQRWFGLDAFLLMHPDSFSRRILDEAEAGSLLSAAALALAAAGLSCPLLLPVHDGLRDAYWGVAVLPGVGCLHVKTDSVHISSPPRELTHLSAQLSALGEQLMPFSPTAAVACFDAAQVDEQQAPGEKVTGEARQGSTQPIAAAAATTTGGGHRGGDQPDDTILDSSAVRITWSACFTYRVTQPSRRLGAHVERWSEAAEAAEAAEREALVTAVEAQRRKHDIAAATPTAAQHLLRGSRVGSHPLDAWHGSLVAAARAGGDGDGDGSAQLGSPSGGRHGGGSSRCAHVENMDKDSHDDDDEDEDDGFGLFAAAAPWDSHAPWSPWAMQTDPVAVMEVDIAWEDLPVPLQPYASSPSSSPSSVGLVGQERQRQRQPPPPSGPEPHTDRPNMQTQPQQDQQSLPQLEVNSSHRWLLHALQVGTGGSGGFGLAGSMWGRVGLRPREAQRKHVELQRAGADWLWSAVAAESWRRPGGRPPPSVTPVSAASQVGPGSFTVMLSSLLTGRSVAADAGQVGELLDPEWWEARGWAVPPLPPPHVMQQVLQDLFNHAAPRPPANDGNHVTAKGRDGSGGMQAGGGVSGGSLPYQRTAPLQGLLSRLALHALVFGNARAVAWLWQRFVRELRFACWEVDRQLPRMEAATPAPPPSLPPPPTPPKADGDDEAGDGNHSNEDMEVERVLLRLQYEDPPPPLPSLCYCLLHQKLQVLDGCIHRRKMLSKQLQLWQHLEQQAQQIGKQRQAQRTDNRDRGQQHGTGADAAAAVVEGSKKPPPPPPRLDDWGWRKEGSGEESDDDDWSWWTEQSNGGGGEERRSVVELGATPVAAAVQADVDSSSNDLMIRSRTLKRRHGGGGVRDGKESTAGDGESSSVGRRQHEAGGGRLPPPTRHSQTEALVSADLRGLESSLHSGDSDGNGDGSGGFPFAAPTAASPSQRASYLIRVSSITDNEAYYSAGDDQDEQQLLPPPMQPLIDGAATVTSSPPAPPAAPAGVAASAPTASRRQDFTHTRVRVPALTQPCALLSEDRMLERQAALESLAMHPQGGELAWRMNSEQLASDMAAFKAANPGGCSFADFISWYSPRDVIRVSGTADCTENPEKMAAETPPEAAESSGAESGNFVVLSARMGSGSLSGRPAFGTATASATDPGGMPKTRSSNPWRRLWDTTAASPIWKQKPLQDPDLEGERVLHELETLSPATLYDNLLATALAAAVQLLGTSGGGSLPPVASLLQQYIRISAPIIKRGCSLLSASGGIVPPPLSPPPPPGSTEPIGGSARDGPGGAAHHDRPMGPQSPQAAHHQAPVGWEDVELEYLLAEFHYLEQAVVLGESLVRRLPGNRGLAADLMTATLHGIPGLEEGRTVMRPAAWVEGPVARQALAALLAGRCPPPPPPPLSPQPAWRHKLQHQHQHQPHQGRHSFQGKKEAIIREGAALGGSSSGSHRKHEIEDGLEGADWRHRGGGGAADGVGRHGSRGRSGGRGGGETPSGSRWRRGGSGGGSSGTGTSGSSDVFSADLWPAPCSREWLLKVDQPLGPGAQLHQHQGQGQGQGQHQRHQEGSTGQAEGRSACEGTRSDVDSASAEALMLPSSRSTPLPTPSTASTRVAAAAALVGTTAAASAEGVTAASSEDLHTIHERGSSYGGRSGGGGGGGGIKGSNSSNSAAADGGGDGDASSVGCGGGVRTGVQEVLDTVFPVSCNHPCDGSGGSNGDSGRDDDNKGSSVAAITRIAAVRAATTTTNALGTEDQQSSSGRGHHQAAMLRATAEVLADGAATAKLVSSASPGDRQGGGDGEGLHCCTHRLYVLSVEGEMRVATTIWHTL